MISPEKKEILASMKDSQYGAVLKEYLIEKENALNDVTTIQTWDEALGRKHALKLIQDIFSMLEYKKPVDKGKNLYT